MQPDLAPALSREWEIVNALVFGHSLLRPATVEVVPHLHHHAADWNPGTRTIRFSQTFVGERPWWVVVEVLKHEMAHQYVSDVLGIEDEETAHGNAFRMVCARYGIDGRAGHKTSEEEQRIVDKARKLLALGGSSNEHEAQNALAQMQRLLGRHGLSEEDVRERNGDDFGALPLGSVIPRRELHHSLVATLLAGHFNVRPIWIQMEDPLRGVAGVQLEVVGKRSDIAMAEYVHDWLHRLADELCPPGLSAKARTDFKAGVISGQKRRLDADAATAGAAARGDSVAMVKERGRAQRLDDYYNRRHPTARSARRSRRTVTASFFRGEAEGRAATMRRPLEEERPVKMLKGK